MTNESRGKHTPSRVAILSSRQKYVLRWLNSHDTYKASWSDKPGHMTIRGHHCSISIAEMDWHALRGLITSLPVPSKIFGLSEAGRAALAKGDTP